MDGLSTPVSCRRVQTELWRARSRGYVELLEEIGRPDEDRLLVHVVVAPTSLPERLVRVGGERVELAALCVRERRP